MTETDTAASRESTVPFGDGRACLVVGVDGSPPSLRALDFAAQRARSTGERLLLIHAIDEPTYSFSYPQENDRRPAERRKEVERAEASLQPLVQRAGEGGVEVYGLVRHGHPAQTLAKLATAYDATHIIVGRTGEGRVRTLLFGSTPSHLIQLAEVPVTVVP